MSGGRVRIWDLCQPADVRALLTPLSLIAEATRLPLPCRAAVFSPELAGAVSAAGIPGVLLLHGEGGAVLAGSAEGLELAARSLPAGLGSRLTRALDAYGSPPAALRFADGECWELARRPRVMGVLNVTPDSFSDGGSYDALDTARARAAEMAAEGAEIIDVGGESTRPGADPVDAEEEARRVVPVIGALRRDLPRARISVDTRRAVVAEKALDMGADIINDVTALSEPRLAALAAERGTPVVLMHMRGTPRTMQQHTDYDDLLGEITFFLAERAERAEEAGIASDRILVDPGIGFGKSAAANESILRQLGTLRSLGYGILVGVSRKNFIGRRTGVEQPAARVAGSLAAASAAVLAGARVVRAHDVRATAEALAMSAALCRWPGAEDEG